MAAGATVLCVQKAVDTSPLLLGSTAIRGGAGLSGADTASAPYPLPGHNAWVTTRLLHTVVLTGAMGCRHHPRASQPCLPYTFQYAHLQMYQRVGFSGVAVC